MCEFESVDGLTLEPAESLKYDNYKTKASILSDSVAESRKST